MTVLKANSGQAKMMADGTLRLPVDFMPADAKAAFSLFGTPGTELAVAALKNAPAPEPAPEPPKGGSVARWLGIQCKDAEFQRWVIDNFTLPTEVLAAVMVRHVCQVATRAEIDSDQQALDRFHRLIREPWMSRLAAPLHPT